MYYVNEITKKILISFPVAIPKTNELQNNFRCLLRRKKQKKALKKNKIDNEEGFERNRKDIKYVARRKQIIKVARFYNLAVFHPPTLLRREKHPLAPDALLKAFTTL